MDSQHLFHSFTHLHPRTPPRTPHRCQDIDTYFRENILFDPIPSAFLRASSPIAKPPPLTPGGRGALREWWGWGAGKGQCINAQGKQYLKEVWDIPWAVTPGTAEPSLRVDVPANGSEIITELWTPPTPFKGMNCYMETITAYFRPKFSATFAFKLYSHDYNFARMFFNPEGTAADGAVEAASARDTRWPSPAHRQSEFWDPKSDWRAAHARSAGYPLEKGKLYYMKIYHPASVYNRFGSNSFRLQLVVSDLPSTPHRAPKYVKTKPCEPVAVSESEDYTIDLVDDSWLVAPHSASQVTLTHATGSLARCGGGAAGCAVPPLQVPAAEGRRLQEKEPAAATGAAATATASATDQSETGDAAVDADGDEETDDNIKFHPEPPFLPPIDEIPARAPFGGLDAKPLGELRREWASGETVHAHAARRLQSSSSLLSSPMLWSDPGTWGGNAPPNSSTPIVFIPNGTHIRLDTSIYIRIWVIEGILSFADGADLDIGAEAILVNHGELHAGSKSSPFQSKLTFTLHGHWGSHQLPVFGIKFLGLTRGKMSIHGKPKTPWAKLGATSSADQSILTLESPPTGWEVGDALAVTSMAPSVNCTMARNDLCEVEEVTVQQVNGATVTLSAPLRYDHTVEVVAVAGRNPVFLHTEVVNLNRNVKITGAMAANSAGFGGHVMLLQPTDGESSLSHVEFTKMGQSQRVGRYPLHMHAVTEAGGVGDLTSMTVEGVSVHHSFNRGINIHGGRGAQVLSSTIYKNLGHAFFVEDGSETGNVFRGNLGALTMRAMSLLESDQTPSTFWITNVDNVFEDNVAAGGDSFGFWINLPKHPGGFLSFKGATFRDDIFPQHSMLGSFKRNTAHGYLTGVLGHDIDPKVFDKRLQVKRTKDAVTGKWYKKVDDTPGMRRTARLESITTYANRESGMIIAESGHVHISNYVSIRQPAGLEALIYVAEQWGEASNGWEAPYITDALIVGGPTAECGLWGPMSSWLTLNNISFVDFPSTARGALCACKLCKDIKGGHELRTKGLSFSGVHNRVNFGHHTVTNIRDLDGSLSGLPSGGWLHGVSEDGSLGYFPPSHCAISTTLGATKSRKAVITCSPDVALRTFRWRHVQPQAEFKTKSLVVSSQYGSSVEPWYLYDIQGRTSNSHTTLVTGVPTRVDYLSGVQFPVDHMGWSSGEVCEMRSDEHFIVEVPTLTNPNRWGVEGNEVELPLKEGLDALDAPNRVNGFWKYTPAVYNEESKSLTSQGLLRMMVSPKADGGTYPDGTDAKPACSEDCHEGQRCISLDLTRHECAPAGCFVDDNSCLGDARTSLAPPPPKNASWCTANSWWSVPVEGQNVTIAAGETVYLSACTTAILNRLDIYGTLKFVDGSASVLRATHIHVAAETGRLEAGTVQNPFVSLARIQLFGNRYTPPYPSSGGLGSKFIGVFGELSLVGTPLAPSLGTQTWSRLKGVTADSGSVVLSVVASWASAVGLQAGDSLLVGPSGLQWNESEIVTVGGCCNATEGVDGAVDVRIDAPLAYAHRGHLNATFLGTQQPFMAAEVAVVRTADDRALNVVVEGMEDAQGALEVQQYGASIHIMKRSDTCKTGGGPGEAKADISGVLVRHCGQRGWLTRPCIQVGPHEQVQPHYHQWDAKDRVLIQNNVISAGYNTGIRLDRVHEVIVDGNVVSDVFGFGLLVDGQRNKLRNNYVTMVTDSYDASMGMSWGYRWAYGQIQSIACHARGRGNVITGNVCSGAEGIAALTDGYECGAEATIADNVAHSSQVGYYYDQRCATCHYSYIFGSCADGAKGVSTRPGYAIGPDTVGTCYEVASWSVHSTTLYGVRAGLLGIPGIGHKGPNSASTVFRNFTLVDTGIGFYFTAVGPDSTKHDKSRPDQHWKVSGATVLASNTRCRQYGFVNGHFWNVIKPWGPGTVTDTIIRESPALYGATLLENSYFDGFGQTTSEYSYPHHFKISCSVGDRNLAISSDIRDQSIAGSGELGADGLSTPNIDTANTLFVSGLTFGPNVETDSKYKLQPSDPSYIGDKGCAQMDCDGRRSQLIVDEDGSLLGSPGTAFALNEVRWNASLRYVDPMGHKKTSDLIPSEMKVDAAGNVRPESEIYTAAGISRAGASCTWKEAHGAYECIGGQHRQLIVEDVTHQAMEHRIGPVALVVDGHLSLATGPQNYALAGYVTSVERLSTFWMTAVLTRLNEIYFSSTVPKRLRLHLRDVDVSVVGAEPSAAGVDPSE